MNTTKMIKKARRLGQSIVTIDSMKINSMIDKGSIKSAKAMDDLNNEISLGIIKDELLWYEYQCFIDVEMPGVIKVLSKNKNFILVS